MSRRIHAYESEDQDPDDDVEAGDDASEAPRRGRPPHVEILLRGARFVVVAKPAGIATVPERHGSAPSLIEAVHALLRAKDPEAAPPVVCHRLDKDTSGCLVLATDRDAARELMRQFRQREVTKAYLALVTGGPQPPSGTVSFRIAPDRRRPGTMWIPKKGGKVCASDYETLEAFRGVTLVRVRPRTGRMHEVRIALRHLGTPCAVDRLYGEAEGLFLSRWKRDYRVGRGRSERPLIDRLTLHAEELSFHDPDVPAQDAGATVTVQAPLPKDLAATLRQLRRHAAPGTL